MLTKPWREIRDRKLPPSTVRRIQPGIDGVRRWWNYRIVRHDKGTDREWLALHEVHYEDGKPVGVSAEPTTFVSDLSIRDLRGSVERAAAWVRKRHSVLDFEDFHKPPSSDPKKARRSRVRRHA
jgi:hypothetical protein